MPFTLTGDFGNFKISIVVYTSIIIATSILVIWSVYAKNSDLQK